MDGKYSTITIRTTDKVKEELITMANVERRTLGGFVYLILLDYLEGVKNTTQKITREGK